jgi:hypothetical protein
MPSAYAAHPEFGYLCPSRRMRRGMRVALSLLVLGLIAGATSMMPTTGSYDGHVDAVSAAGHAVTDFTPAPGAATAAIKMRVVRAVTNAPAIARVPLGRSGSPRASTVEPLLASAFDQQAASPPPSESTSPAPVETTATAATDPSRHANVAPKPQRKARRQRDQDWRDGWSWREARSERWSRPDHAYASYSWHNRYSYAGSWGSSW